MEISILTAIALKSTNVTDDTDVLDFTQRRDFQANCKVQYGGLIYQNVSDTVYVPEYDDTGGTSYDIGDLVFKDGSMQKAVNRGTNKVQKEPWDYPSVDNDPTNPSSWSNRYVKLFDNFVSESSSFVTGSLTHNFKYYPPNFTSEQIVSSLTPTSAVNGQIHTWGGYLFYSIASCWGETPAKVESNTEYGFFTYFQNGTTLYARTHISAEILYDDVPGDVLFAPITKPTDIPGLVKVKANNITSPFDEFIHNKATRVGSISYSMIVDGKFDTLCLAGVIGDTIDVVFRDESGSQVGASIVGYPINNSRGNPNLPPYPTTAVVYCSSIVPKGGSIDVSINGSYTEIGEFACGLAVNSGFSNLQFTTSYKDHSPKNIDNWGNIEYISGVKVLTYASTCDVQIENYDDTARLMNSLGQGKVIVNGSDSTDNATPDSLSIFSSTMVLGRISNFSLKTKLKGNDMHPLATYSFLLTELT